MIAAGGDGRIHRNRTRLIACSGLLPPAIALIRGAAALPHQLHLCDPSLPILSLNGGEPRQNRIDNDPCGRTAFTILSERLHVENHDRAFVLITGDNPLASPAPEGHRHALATRSCKRRKLL